MKHRVTAETAIIITKYAITPIGCWPLPVGSSSLVVFRRNLYLGIIMIHLVYCFAVSLYTVYEYRYDIVRVIKVLSQMLAVISTLAKIIICKIEAPRIQLLITDMQMFLKQATRDEKKLIQSYVDKCLMPHAIVLVSVVFGPLIYIAGPLLTSRPFPGEAVYPFPTESNWVWAASYCLQSICIMQVGCAVIIDVLIAILLWYAGARFHMLCLKFQSATNNKELSQCIRAHQKLIGYVDELIITTRIMAVEVTIIGMYGVIGGGFLLILNQPSYEMVKYIFFEFGCAMQLFLFTWPADNLIEVSQRVGDAAYSCDWIGKPPEMLKNLVIVILRCRKPVVISIDGLLPVLSLEFYASTMAATLSYLTTLRAIAME